MYFYIYFFFMTRRNTMLKSCSANLLLVILAEAWGAGRDVGTAKAWGAERAEARGAAKVKAKDQ